MRINYDNLNEDEKFFVGDEGNIEVIIVETDYSEGLVQYISEFVGFIDSKHLDAETIAEFGVI